MSEDMTIADALRKQGVTDEQLERLGYGDAPLVRDGIAVFIAPGGIPVIFDREGMAQVAGDLANRGVEQP